MPDNAIEFVGTAVSERFVPSELLDANVFSFHLPTRYVHFIGSGGDLIISIHKHPNVKDRYT